MYLCSTDMTVLQVLMYVVLQLAITKTIDSFEYNFPVNSTKTCPMNAKEWSNASIRMHCNDTHGYHCVPDKNFSSLIEFCYPRGRRIPFQKGNCLELAYTGILNHVKCGHFTYGCPDKDYFSNEIYQYPACLRLADNCFAADLSCLKKEYSTQKQIDKTEANSSCLMKQSTREENIYTALIVAVIIISVLLLSMILVVLILCQKIHKQKQPAKDKEEDIHESLLGNNQEPQSPTNEVPSEQPEAVLHAAHVTRECGSQTDQEINISDEITREILADYSIENAQLFGLLKRQCMLGSYHGFHHLLSSRIQGNDNRKVILHQRDDNGLVLLHYAAMGGSMRIFKDILDTDENLKVDVKCSKGQTALHYAIQERKVDMSIDLIAQYKELLNSIKIDDLGSVEERTEIQRDIKNQIISGLESIHWIAWIGNLKILEALKKRYANTHFDMGKTTLNGLNILDIACLATENDFCKHVIASEKQIDVGKTDISGWNVAHYAARVDNSNFFEILKQFRKENLIEIETKSEKTTLHIACEYANEKAVDYLLENHETLLGKHDELKWNALHYAAKGGNVRILKTLIGKGLNIYSLTVEEKTLLHIACIHKRVEICKYVVDEFVKAKRIDLINKKTTNHGWTAAHYLGVEKKENGNEETILDILYECNMDLKEPTGDGYSILDIAMDHKNERLVNHILSDKYVAAMDISKQKQKQSKEAMQKLKKF